MQGDDSDEKSANINQVAVIGKTGNAAIIPNIFGTEYGVDSGSGGAAAAAVQWSYLPKIYSGGPD